MELLVDTREHQAIAAFSGTNITVKQLDIGDFQIVSKCVESDEDDVVMFVIERKTLADLLASIKDGRYHEQKCRAISVYGKAKFAYICEIDEFDNFWSEDTVIIKSKEPVITSKQLKSAIINTMMRDGIPVFFSNGVCDTCELVKNLFAKIVKDSSYFTKNVTDVTGMSYKATHMKKKKNNVKDPKTVAELQLSAIPTVSIGNAITILNALKASSISDVILSLKKSNDAKTDLLKMDQIGKKKAESILKYLSI